MIDSSVLLWKPLLEASAQTIVGAIGAFSVSKVLEQVASRNTFDGTMDLWKRGLETNLVQEDDQVFIDGLVSPYTQLFPGNPIQNGRKWNGLYEFEGKISSGEYQAMDFFAGGDAALRVQSLNGETITGIYARYGYVGDGIIGIAPTKLIRKILPSFFEPNFWGVRAMIGGRLARCPTQHGHIAQAIAAKAGISIDLSQYRNLYYLKINSIRLFRNERDRTCTLIGSPWTATDNTDEQYIVQYGYFDNKDEIEQCIKKMKSSQNWGNAQVFFDDLTSPSEELSFSKSFLR